MKSDVQRGLLKADLPRAKLYPSLSSGNVHSSIMQRRSSYRYDIIDTARRGRGTLEDLEITEGDIDQ